MNRPHDRPAKGARLVLGDAPEGTCGASGGTALGGRVSGRLGRREPLTAPGPCRPDGA
jgi:hypothetical protein